MQIDICGINCFIANQDLRSDPQTMNYSSISSSTVADYEFLSDWLRNNTLYRKFMSRLCFMGFT